MSKKDIRGIINRNKIDSPNKGLIKEVGVNKKIKQNVGNNETTNVVRKRVSFDISTDLHRRIKMEALQQEENIYILVEKALEQYLDGR